MLAPVVLSLAVALLPAPTPAPPPRPSILLVTIDTLRADRVGCYGYALARTPALDALAGDGVLFEEARSHVPLTLPSHATILTGRLPPRHGLRGNGIGRLPEGVPTLAEALREAGWSTGAVVGSVVLDRAHGLDRGFAAYDDNQRVGERAAFDYAERGASQVAASAVRLLEQLEPPFFLWVHLYDPHHPWIAPASLRARHPGRPYDAEIEFADAALGQVRAAAQARAPGGLVVAVTSDHGESLGEHGEMQHGYTLHRGVLRVPLLLAGPVLPRGVRVRDTIGLVDLAPTLADLVGLRIGGVDGRSLRGAWSRGVPPVDEAELWEETLHPLLDSGWAPLRGLLTPRWHFVQAPRPELYDRRADPGDRQDVAVRHGDVVRRLAGRLATRMRAMGDAEEPALPDPPSSPEERERLEKLASLGYLTGGLARRGAGARLDPKDGLPGFRAIEDADRLLGEQKAAEARRLLEPHVRRDPSNPRLWHQLGRALAAEGNLVEAERALATAVTLDPRSAFLRATLAGVLRSRGDEAGAREQLRTILATSPRDVDATLELASMDVARGDVAAAEAVLLTAHRAGARDPALLDLLGSLAKARGDAAAASAYFEQALALHPDDPLALLETGRAALSRGDFPTAMTRLTRCGEAGPRAFECRIELARAWVVGSGDRARARAELERAGAVARDERQRQEVARRLEALATSR